MNDDEEANEDEEEEEEDSDHEVEWVGWDPTMAPLKEHMQECQWGVKWPQTILRTQTAGPL